MISASKLISKIKKYNKNIDDNLVKKAYIFSKSNHGNQTRHSGEPYFSHPLAVAEILIDLKMDQNSIIAALLHDVVEDTQIDLSEIEQEFSKEVAGLVDGVTKLKKIESASSEERVAQNFRKLTLAMSKDIRVLLIKLADRLHNLRTIYYIPSREKKVKKARESLEIYAPLAARIGLNKIKDEMQELAFEVIEPRARRFIIDKLDKLVFEKKYYIKKVKEQISHKLKLCKIEFEISGRQKTPYSIFRKMKFRNVGFHHLYDIMAFRVVVKNISECYRVLGIINTNYNMIPGTFRDYISTPKENGYRSLHLTILGPLNKKIEIQIRDKTMHNEAELGLAAHWIYKNNNLSDLGKNNEEIENKKENIQYRWLRDLISLFENSQNLQEVIEQSKLDFHKDNIFCFTPKGEIFNLPIGSTAVDFAYAIHSEVGNACSFVKINSITSPLRQRLENGDQVEIKTSENARPSPNWLQFVATQKAKSAIRSFIRDERLNEHKELGISMLKKFFKTREKEFKQTLIEEIYSEFKAISIDDLYVKVAEGLISRYDILKRVYPDIKDEDRIKINLRGKKRFKDNSLPINGIFSAMSVHFASCCNPIPGDIIIGIINTGSGVTIHNQDCNNLKNTALGPEKIIDVSWKFDNKDNNIFYNSRINVLISNKSGSLAKVTNVISKIILNIINIRVVNRNSQQFSIDIDIEVKDKYQLEEAISALKVSDFVIKANRVFY